MLFMMARLHGDVSGASHHHGIRAVSAEDRVFFAPDDALFVFIFVFQLVDGVEVRHVGQASGTLTVTSRGLRRRTDAALWRVESGSIVNSSPSHHKVSYIFLISISKCLFGQI